MKVLLAGKHREALLTVKAIKTYCESKKIELADFLASISTPDMEGMQLLIYSALLGAAAKEGTEPGITLEEVQQITDSWSFSELATVFSEVITDGIGKKEKAPATGA